MLIDIPTSSGVPSFAMVSLLSDRFSGYGIWDSGARTSLSGCLGLEFIRGPHVFLGMEDSFEIDTAPDKQLHFRQRRIAEKRLLV